MRWGIETNISLPTATRVVCFCSLRPQRSEYHYNIMKKCFTKSATPPSHPFFLLLNKIYLHGNWHSTVPKQVHLIQRKLCYASAIFRGVHFWINFSMSSRQVWYVNTTFLIFCCNFKNLILLLSLSSSHQAADKHGTKSL